MRYTYYPGCSLEGSAIEYSQATKALLHNMEIELMELEDWTCCGASAAEAQSGLLALALSGRNLALAEKMSSDDILVPCSACYLNLAKAERKIATDHRARATVNHILEPEGIAIQGSARPRHLLDILATDLGPDAIGAKVKRPLQNLVVAPYYGCQCLRPLGGFDDPENPKSMDGLIEACGADLFRWQMGPKCCGAALMSTKPEVGLTLTGKILEAAKGTDVIVTVCPMCQMNLEAYQGKISRRRGINLEVSVIYLPQLIGLALGINPDTLGLKANLAITADFREYLSNLKPEAG